ncbi:NAD(P)/FAD-dependent oxidoreductase [Rhodovulum euryhalinum]|uniref:NADPH-dependent 2,4-dienoyl-CoA reductase/sulfur reductase-like enzyme n=1 Tax=Rhodovulum euryhalinum TaxID=35805 RepID=A0A4R2KZH8_9RHOB|nr:NAD(P)/FAD-dependent oxidoreductase [Rhodovulum euryhalinum]TCO72115.1 NADPH-dependent 2,4-dienoyl-CoA reductase/sulfur reductase-like enzyme [Rhodovulum euryhalinum]
MDEVDLLILGAGPAGMAAAAEAAGAGLVVALLDEQARPGGQIYRDVTAVPPARAAILGPEYRAGRPLAEGLADPRIRHIPGATAWKIDPDRTIAYSVDGKAALIRGRRLLIASGALERPVPIPGWTLPGVMTAGAAQILLKQSGILPRRAVIAGSGPLLYLIAAQMVRAGTPPLALVETQTRGDLLAALPHLPGAIRGWRSMAKGLGWIAELKRAGVPRHRGARDLAVDGAGRAEALALTAGGRRRTIPCETVLLHEGVVPNIQATRLLGLPHRWDQAQRCFVPRHDRWGETPLPGIHVAGDGAGIGGALVAELSGRLVGLCAAAALGRLDPVERDRRAAPLFRTLARERAVRPFLDAAYPPGPQTLSPADGTIVCRCEEVTAGEIRRHARLGCKGPNQAKAFGRAGMGPCQGRFCGLAVTAILAEANGQSPDETGYFRIRPPIKPVTLAEIAAMAPTGPDKDSA